ncbi:HTH-type transcriptional regulatory protein GabR [compost metagenome]
MKLVHVTPSHQFPTGVVLSLPRRLALLDWARTQGALIVEDDYDSEFRYGDRPIPSLQGLDATGVVLYVGTFSKVLFPSLRLGYMVVPHEWAPLFARAKWLADRQSPLLEQLALTDFIVEGHLERHVRRMRVLYEGRRRCLLQALREHLGDRVTILGDHAGLHVTLRLRTQLDGEAIAQRAAALGVGIATTRACYLAPPEETELVLGYADLDERIIDLGIRRLAAALDES